MKLSKIKLSKQLLIIIAIAFALLFTSLGVILPKVLIPVAEANLYNYLSEPLKYMDGEFDKKLDNTEVAYLYVLDKYNMLASDNLNDIIKIKDPKNLLNKITDVYGKFDYNHRTYYYYTITNDNIIKIAISNDNYINRTKANILGTIFPIVLITFLIIGLILGIWSLIIVLKLYHQ